MQNFFLKHLAVRRGTKNRTHRIQSCTADFKRIQRLRKRVRVFRYKQWDVPTALAIFGHFSELSIAIDLCCDFIRVHHAPGQNIVNEIWQELRFARELFENMQQAEVEKQQCDARTRKNTLLRHVLSEYSE